MGYITPPSGKLPPAHVAPDFSPFLILAVGNRVVLWQRGFFVGRVRRSPLAAALFFCLVDVFFAHSGTEECSSW